ncbi:hypothetical protein AKJ16_DCAP03830 [Drosera capensis]
MKAGFFFFFPNSKTFLIDSSIGGHAATFNQRQAATSGGGRNLSTYRLCGIRATKTTRKIKRTNQSASAPEVNDSIRTDEEPQHETNEASTINEEVERQISTIKAMSEMELEHLLTSVRLLRSYISEEHLRLPVSQFCKEHLPNLAPVKDGIDGHFSLRWKEEDGHVAMRNGDTGDFPASLLRHIAMGYPKIPNLSAMRELSNMQTFGLQDGLHTPEVCGQRMSVGMTPKTQRLPQPGEMLLSVGGSPLGVYKEDKVEEGNVNLEAISETENY